MPFTPPGGFPGFDSFIANVGESHLQGFEVETELYISTDVQLFASLGVTDSEFEDFVLGWDGSLRPGVPAVARLEHVARLRLAAGSRLVRQQHDQLHRPRLYGDLGADADADLRPQPALRTVRLSVRRGLVHFRRLPLSNCRIVLLVWVFVVSATGIINTWGFPMIGTYPTVTGRQLPERFAWLKGRTDATERRREVAQLLERVNRGADADRAVATYSGGTLRRFGIALALAGNPRLLIVDEPTAGLDPAERSRFHLVPADIAADNIVLLSTHIVPWRRRSASVPPRRCSDSLLHRTSWSRRRSGPSI